MSLQIRVIPESRESKKMNIEPYSLKKKVLNGFIWLSSGTFVGQIISWLSTIFIIRILSPSDYGLMAMTGTFIALLTMISEFGIGASVIQAREIREDEIQQVFGAIILISVFGWLICLVAAPSIAIFYNEHQLVMIIRVLSINIILIAFYIVPQSLFVREMDFKTKAKIDVLAQVGSAVFTLILAFRGMGLWSLIGGLICLHLIKLIGFNLGHATWLSPTFRLKGAGKFIKFGFTVMISRLFYYIFRQSDHIIIGRFLGDRLLGVYSIASNLSSIPGEKALPIINSISFSSYSRIQDDIQRVRQNVLRAARIMSGLSFPLFFGMAGVAPEAIPLILGQRWEAIITPFQMLCLSLPLKVLDPILASAVIAIGRPRVNLINMIITSSGMTLAFLIGIRYGIIGICLAWILAYPIVFSIICIRCLIVLDIHLDRFLSEILIPLLVSAAMLLFIIMARNLLSSISLISFLAISVPCGAFFYLGALALLKKEEYMEIVNLITKN